MKRDLHIRAERGVGGLRVTGDLCCAPLWCRFDGSVLWMVGAAAFPLAEDRLGLTLDVGPGAELDVRSVAAMVAYAARGEGTGMDLVLEVADGAALRWAPEPLIVTGRARHRNHTTVRTSGSGTAVVDEVTVLGRAGEQPGGARSSLELSVDGERRLLTAWDIDAPGWNGPGGADGRKVLATRLVTSAADIAGECTSAQAPSTVDQSLRRSVLRLEGGGLLVSAVGSNVAAATDALTAVG